MFRMSPWKDIGKLSAKDEAKREAEFQARLLAELNTGTAPKPAAPRPSTPAPTAAEGISLTVTEAGKAVTYSTLESVPLAVRQRIVNAWLSKPVA
jgi:hypothetical protein